MDRASRHAFNALAIAIQTVMQEKLGVSRVDFAQALMMAGPTRGPDCPPRVAKKVTGLLSNIGLALTISQQRDMAT